MRTIFRNYKGVALVLVILLVTMLMFLSMYFLTTALSENLIARSQAWGNKTYYLAETGINEMVWLIQNDPEFNDNFINNATWSTTTSRTDPFGPDSGSYTVTITNTSKAHGEIVSLGSIDISSGRTAQRIVKTRVYQAIGDAGIEDSSGYADGNIDISSSNVNFFDGSAHSNNVFDVNNDSYIYVDSNLKAVGNYNEHWSASTTIAGDIYAANYDPPGPAAEIAMPAVDFDFYEDWAIASGTHYTSGEFEDLLKDNMTLILNDTVTFVDGEVDVRGARTLIINNGLLVIGNNRDFKLGRQRNWEGGNGPSSLIITHASGTPSGVLAERHVDILQYTDVVDVAGIIYAGDWLTLSNLNTETSQFDIVGGLLARKLTITSCWLPTYINIYHDSNILTDSLGAASSSQVIVVEHWEEEY